MAASRGKCGRAAVVIAAAAFVACSPSTKIDARVAAITNGSDDSGDPDVVALLQGTTLVCTATLIAPRVLVTAAHCVQADDALPVAHFGATPGSGDVAVPIALARRHPGFDPSTLTDDIALALLDGEAPAGAIPAALPATALDDGAVGTTLRLVGFGRTAAGDTSSPRKRQGTATLSSLDADTLAFAPSPSQTCEGDSGGPAFASVGSGAEAIVGVTSSGDAMCDVMARDMRVGAFVADFIAPFVAATAAGGAGAGDRCYYDGNCATGAGECLAALDDAALSFCAPPCTGGCPAGLTCLPDGNGVERCRHATPSPGAPGAACDGDDACDDGQCVAAARGGGPVCAATCFPDLPGFCDPGFGCLPVAGGGSACFAEAHRGCSFSESETPPPWLDIAAIWLLAQILRRRKAAFAVRFPRARDLSRPRGFECGQRLWQ